MERDYPSSKTGVNVDLIIDTFVYLCETDFEKAKSFTATDPYAWNHRTQEQQFFWNAHSYITLSGNAVHLDEQQTKRMQDAFLKANAKIEAERINTLIEAWAYSIKDPRDIVREKRKLDKTKSSATIKE